MKQVIKKIIFENLKKEYSVDSSNIEILKTSDSKIGDYTTNLALRLSKEKKMNSMELAEEIKKLLEKKLNKKVIEKITITKPGFVNFFITKKFVIDNALKFLDEKYKYDFGIKKQKINYEFISANPTGDLHIGHARNAIVGDVTASALSYIGHDVYREYYINDFGVQITTLGQSVFFYYAKELNHKIELTKEDIGYHGKEIISFAKELAKSNPTLIKMEFKEALEEIKKIGTKHFLTEIKTLLNDKLKIKTFDKFASEKYYFDSLKADNLIKQLKKEEKAYEKDGALWLATTRENDDKDRVLIKKNGETTYMVGDLTYHQDKYKRGFDHLIDLWGKDHHGYEGRIRAGLCLLGHDSKNNFEVNFISMVQVTDGGDKVKMSKRAGTSLRIKDMLEKLETNLFKYYIISKTKEQNLTVDINASSTKDMSNPYYYCQYVNARIEQILKKYLIKYSELPKLTEITALGNSEKEMRLLKKILEWNDIIYSVAINREPNLLIIYLKDIAKTFHSFYNYCIVISDDKKLSEERILLIMAVKNLLKVVFDVLGIEPLYSM